MDKERRLSNGQEQNQRDNASCPSPHLHDAAKRQFFVLSPTRLLRRQDMLPAPLYNPKTSRQSGCNRNVNNNTLHTSWSQPSKSRLKRLQVEGCGGVSGGAESQRDQSKTDTSVEENSSRVRRLIFLVNSLWCSFHVQDDPSCRRAPHSTEEETHSPAQTTNTVGNCIRGSPVRRVFSYLDAASLNDCAILSRMLLHWVRIAKSSFPRWLTAQFKSLKCQSMVFKRGTF